MSVGSDMPTKRGGAGRPLINIWLDDSALDTGAQAAWHDFLNFACESVGGAARIEAFSGMPPDSSLPFVYLSDSAALTRKLLLYGVPIHIQPKTAPEYVDGHVYWQWLVHRRDVLVAANLKPVQRGVTLISSIYRGDVFLDGFLRNSARLQGYADCEHLLVRAASPGNEHEGLVKHVRAHSGAVYLNLAQDPGLYEVWNLGVRLATGRYLSNANIDDRRAPEHLAFLRDELASKTHVDVASAALRISTEKNLDWESSGDCPLLFARVADKLYTASALFKHSASGLSSRNLPHCMPLWRRSLHARVGMFNEKRYGPSADWAFWLQAGRHGVMFSYSQRPLGLYLRDEATYWRRDPANRKFDAYIAKSFADLAQENADRKAGSTHRLARPVAQVVSKTVMMLRAGACYEGLGWLLKVAASDMYRRESTRELVDKVARRFLGCSDFADVAIRFVRLMDADGPFDLALFNALVDLVHGFDPILLGEAAHAIERTLKFVCHDLHACTGDIRGLLLLAMLARKRADWTAEQVLLQRMHDSDKSAFWLHFQSVYRFVRPLPDVCGAVSTIASSFVINQPATRYHLTYFPDYTKNTYQSLLYSPLRAMGATLRGTSDIADFLTIEPIPEQANILHVHWVSPLFGPDKHNDLSSLHAERAAAFLAGLKRQKERGFTLYWTIHNRLSHETIDPKAEEAFRQALYRLADRVFIHHPLAVSLLDWLPDTGKLCLSEHGDFGVAAADRISRTEARQSIGWNESDFVVMHVGQVRDYKSLADYLPVLFDQLLQTPDMKLVIAGIIQSSAARRWLKEHQHPRLLARNTFLTESELTAYMRAADVGFLAYGATLTSGTLFHWLTCGRAVLAPASGTIPAYLVDGWNGFSYSDSESLKRVLTLCAQLPKAEMTRLEHNARSTAMQLKWGMDV
jgi:glycosyltransferase involved in cell wall biosynthesis